MKWIPSLFEPSSLPSQFLISWCLFILVILSSSSNLSWLPNLSPSLSSILLFLLFCYLLTFWFLSCMSFPLFLLCLSFLLAFLVLTLCLSALVSISLTGRGCLWLVFINPFLWHFYAHWIVCGVLCCKAMLVCSFLSLYFSWLSIHLFFLLFL